MSQKQFIERAGKAADIVLASIGCAFAPLLLYMIYRHGLTGRMVYIVVPMVVAALAFAALKLSPGLKINIVLSCMSLGTAMYAAEAYLYFSDPMPYEQRTPITWTDGAPNWKKDRAKRFAKQFGVDLDTRDKVEVIEELSKRGVDAVPFVSPSNNLFKRGPNGSIALDREFGLEKVVPLAAVAHKLTVLCNESGDWVHYQSDMYGFNNPAKVWNSGPIEIAALGDSFTQGYCVPADESFVGLIRARFSATVNLGVAGNGPLLMLATLREYLTAVRPKIVLWFYYEGNDLANLHDHKNLPLLRRYLERDYTQGLRERQREIDRALIDYVAQARSKPPRQDEESALRRYLKHSLQFVKLVGLRERLGLIPIDDRAQLEAVSDANVALFRDILLQAKEQVETWGGKIYFVYLPTWSRYAQGHAGLSGSQRAKVLDYAKSLDITVIDVHPAIQSQQDPLSLFPFREPGHYNKEGHRIVADEVLKALGSADAAVGSQAGASIGAAQSAVAARRDR